MAITEGAFKFAAKQSLSGNADQNSTNVYDSGLDPATNAPKKVFQGVGDEGKLAIQVTAVGGTNPTFRARFVGADDAALAVNPVVIAETGVSGVLTAADLPVLYELTPAFQQVAKQFYGVIFTLGGTTPTATVNANYQATAQSAGVR